MIIYTLLCQPIYVLHNRKWKLRACVCMYVCMSVQPFEKINATTGVASVEPMPKEVLPNEVRLMIFHQMKFRQIKKVLAKKKVLPPRQKVSSKM